MTERWVSIPKHWCKYCKAFVKGRPHEIEAHNQGEVHKRRVQGHLHALERERNAVDHEMADINRAAAKAMGSDFRNKDTTGYIVQKVPELPKVNPHEKFAPTTYKDLQRAQWEQAPQLDFISYYNEEYGHVPKSGKKYFEEDPLMAVQQSATHPGWSYDPSTGHWLPTENLYPTPPAATGAATDLERWETVSDHDKDFMQRISMAAADAMSKRAETLPIVFLQNQNTFSSNDSSSNSNSSGSKSSSSSSSNSSSSSSSSLSSSSSSTLSSSSSISSTPTTTTTATTTTTVGSTTTTTTATTTTTSGTAGDNRALDPYDRTTPSKELERRLQEARRGLKACVVRLSATTGAGQVEQEAAMQGVQEANLLIGQYEQLLEGRRTGFYRASEDGIRDTSVDIHTGMGGWATVSVVEERDEIDLTEPRPASSKRHFSRMASVLAVGNPGDENEKCKRKVANMKRKASDDMEDNPKSIKAMRDERKVARIKKRGLAL